MPGNPARNASQKFRAMGEKGYIVSLLTGSRWETEAGGAFDFSQPLDFSGEAQSGEWAPGFRILSHPLIKVYKRGVEKIFQKDVFSHSRP